MITLQDYPDRCIPDAADESNIEYRNYPGYPQFVRWRANDDDGNPVIVVIGVHTIKADRINAMLINERAAIQAAANEVYKPGDTEVELFAPATLALAS
jgi:hypothetical protein